MKPKSPFAVWFKAQFGSLPDSPKRVRLSIKVHELESALVYAKVDLQKEEWLRDAFDAALKGWNAARSPQKETE